MTQWIRIGLLKGYRLELVPEYSRGDDEKDKPTSDKQAMTRDVVKFMSTRDRYKAFTSIDWEDYLYVDRLTERFKKAKPETHHERLQNSALVVSRWFSKPIHHSTFEFIMAGNDSRYKRQLDVMSAHLRATPLSLAHHDIRILRRPYADVLGDTPVGSRIEPMRAILKKAGFQDLTDFDTEVLAADIPDKSLNEMERECFDLLRDTGNKSKVSGDTMTLVNNTLKIITGLEFVPRAKRRVGKKRVKVYKIHDPRMMLAMADASTTFRSDPTDYIALEEKEATEYFPSPTEPVGREASIAPEFPDSDYELLKENWENVESGAPRPTKQDQAPAKDQRAKRKRTTKKPNKSNKKTKA